MTNFNQYFPGGFTPIPELLPEGIYTVVINRSNLADNKKLTGINLTLRLEVLNPPYEGKAIYDCLCVENNNEKAQAIAQSKLKDICEAVGVTQITDTKQIIDKPLCARIKIEFDAYATERGGGEDIYCNRIYSYHAISVIGNSNFKASQKIKRPAKQKIGKKYVKNIETYAKLNKMESQDKNNLPFNDDVPF